MLNVYSALSGSMLRSPLPAEIRASFNQLDAATRAGDGLRFAALLWTCVWACVLLFAASAHASATDLRWIPSPSEHVTGYVVHIGAESGFYEGGQVETSIDIGSDFEITGGIAHHPLSNLISQNAWIVMTAYDDSGNVSAGSNSIYKTPPTSCQYDIDCNDDNACNGVESCNAGVCGAGVAPSCAAGGQCTIGGCDPASGCFLEPAANGTTCDDGDSATTGDVCAAAICEGTIPPDVTDPPVDPPTDPPTDPISASYLDDFEGYGGAGEPFGWLDTGASNSRAEADLFHLFETDGGNVALGTDSTLTNIHSHMLAADSANWRDYEFRGRMRIESASAGIGVTLYSRYPDSDHYYRLRHYGGTNFHLARHPDSAETCVGTTDSGVKPAAGTWYSFRAERLARRLSRPRWLGPHFRLAGCLGHELGRKALGRPRGPRRIPRRGAARRTRPRVQRGRRLPRRQRVQWRRKLQRGLL